MSQLSRGDLHVDQLLSNVAQVYSQDAAGFVADRIFPIVPVSKQSDLYKIFNKADFRRSNLMQKRARGTTAPKVGWRASDESYFAHVYALGHDIYDYDRGNEDPIMELEKNGTRLLMNSLMLQKEAQFAAAYLATGVWDFGADGVSGPPTSGFFKYWSDPLSTPIEDIREARTDVLQSSGNEPNKLTLAVDTFNALVDHPDIIDRVKYGQTPGAPAIVNKQALAALFEVDEVLVAKAVHNTGAEKADPTAETDSTFVINSVALLSYAPSAPSKDTPSAGYTFAWTGLPGADRQGIRTKRYRDEPHSADVIEVELAQDRKVTATDCAYLFTNTVASSVSA